MGQLVSVFNPSCTQPCYTVRLERDWNIEFGALERVEPVEGKRPTVPTVEGMRGHFLPKVPKRGAPFQDERETLNSLLMFVTDEMDP